MCPYNAQTFQDFLQTCEKNLFHHLVVKCRDVRMKLKTLVMFAHS